MASTTDIYKSSSTVNKWKRVHVKIGAGKDIWDLFGGSDRDKYFAKNMQLFLDIDNVSFSVSSKFVPVLEQLMEKFKKSSPGKALGLIQKMSDLAAGLDMGAIALGLKGKSGAAGSDILKKLQVLPPNVRYQTKFQNLPAWDSTGPLELGSFTFKFYLGMAGEFNGRTEVYNPALAFAKINQPSVIGSGLLQGPLPNTAWVYGVIGGALGSAISTTVQNRGGEALTQLAPTAIVNPPKPNQLQYIENGTINTSKYEQAVRDWESECARLNAQRSSSTTLPDNTAERLTAAIERDLDTMMGSFEKSLNDAIKNWPGSGLVQLSLGRLTFPPMTVEKTEVKFSYDTDDGGYPIWAEVTWSGCRTLEVATVQQMSLHAEDEDTGENYNFKILSTSFPANSEVATADAASASFNTK